MAMVTITCSTPDAEIRYTYSELYGLPPADPTEESALYSSPFQINFQPIDGYYIKARAYKNGMIASDIAEAVMQGGK